MAVKGWFTIPPNWLRRELAISIFIHDDVSWAHVVAMRNHEVRVTIPIHVRKATARSIAFWFRHPTRIRLKDIEAYEVEVQIAESATHKMLKRANLMPAVRVENVPVTIGDGGGLLCELKLPPCVEMAIAGRARGDTCGERGLDDMTGGEREGETVIGNTDCSAGDRGDDPDSIGVAPP